MDFRTQPVGLWTKFILFGMRTQRKRLFINNRFPYGSHHRFQLRPNLSQTPQQLRDHHAMFPLPFGHSLKYHPILRLCRPGKILRHTPQRPVIAPLQLHAGCLFSRLPYFQQFSSLPGKNPDACQGGNIGLFSPVELRSQLFWSNGQLGTQLPIDGHQLHGLPLELTQIISGGLSPVGLYPLPYLLFLGLIVDKYRLLLYQYSWMAAFFANIFSKIPFLFRSYVL